MGQNPERAQCRLSLCVPLGPEAAMLARPAMRSSWLPAALACPMRTPWLSAFDLPVVCWYPSPLLPLPPASAQLPSRPRLRSLSVTTPPSRVIAIAGMNRWPFPPKPSPQELPGTPRECCMVRGRGCRHRHLAPPPRTAAALGETNCSTAHDQLPHAKASLRARIWPSLILETQKHLP